MARRKDSPQKAAMREMMRDYLKNNDISIKDGTDVNGIMRDMMSVLLEGALDEELDEELGYSKYDYRNKETDNSRNGHSSKTMHTSYGFFHPLSAVSSLRQALLHSMPHVHLRLQYPPETPAHPALSVPDRHPFLSDHRLPVGSVLRYLPLKAA